MTRYGTEILLGLFCLVLGLATCGREQGASGTTREERVLLWRIESLEAQQRALVERLEETEARCR